MKKRHPLPFPPEAVFLFPLLGLLGVEGEGEDAGRTGRYLVQTQEGQALLYLDSPSGRSGTVLRQKRHLREESLYSKFEVCAGCGAWWESSPHPMPGFSDSILVLKDGKVEYLSPWKGGATGYCAACNLEQGIVWMELSSDERVEAAKVEGRPYHIQSRAYRKIMHTRFRGRLLSLLLGKAEKDRDTALRMVAKLGVVWESALY